MAECIWQGSEKLKIVNDKAKTFFLQKPPDEFSSKTYYNRNPFIRWYFFRLLKTAVRVSGVVPGDTVLDFGCNVQMLRNFLPNGVKYVGYDIKAMYSDVEDYSKIKPKIVFAINTFEHLTTNQLLEMLENFDKMKVKRLVVGNPTNNFLARFLQNLFGMSQVVKETHHQTFWGVESMLAIFHWKKVFFKNVVSFNEIGSWEK